MKLANKERVSKLKVELTEKTDIITEFETAIEVKDAAKLN